METRYLKKKELKYIAKKKQLPNDLSIFKCIGISPISDTFLFLENEKIREENHLKLKYFIKNISDTHDEGCIYVSELSQDNLSEVFSDEIMFNKFFNLEKNPYDLIKLVSLIKLNDNIFWDENVYHNSI